MKKQRGRINRRRINRDESPKPCKKENDDSESVDYYFFCKEEIEFMEYVKPLLFISCESGQLSWDCDMRMIDFLRGEIIKFLETKTEEERGKMYWLNLIMHKKSEFLRYMVHFMHKQFKKDSSCLPPIKKQKMLTPSRNHEISPQLVETSRKEKSSKNPESSLPADIGESSSGSTERQLANPSKAPMADANPSEPPSADEPRDAAAGEKVLMLRRVLQSSDCSNHQQRISMPCNQSKSAEEFLTAEELRNLERASYVPIKVVDPAGRTYDAHLRKTKAGMRTFSYAIGKPWNRIREANRFRVGTVLHIWALRGDDRQLQIHLERV